MRPYFFLLYFASSCLPLRKILCIGGLERIKVACIGRLWLENTVRALSIQNDCWIFPKEVNNNKSTRPSSTRLTTCSYEFMTCGPSRLSSIPDTSSLSSRTFSIKLNSKCHFNRFGTHIPRSNNRDSNTPTDVKS